MTREVYILWAEDDPYEYEVCSKSLYNFLKSKGIEAHIEHASDGNEVFGTLARTPTKFAVVLIDLDMPKFEGLETVEKLADLYKGLPAIVVSGYADRDGYALTLAKFKERGLIRGYYPRLPPEAWCEAVLKIISYHAPAILHLSDIHFGDFHAFKGKNQIQKFITSGLKRVLANGNIDILVVSGDLASKGTKEEFAQAAVFLKFIASELNIGLDKVILVPGNHDIDRGTQQNLRFENFVGFLDSFYGSIKDEVERRRAFERFPEIYNPERVALYRNESGQNELYTPDALYSITVYDDLKTVVIGLNSTISEESRYTLGEITPDQLSDVANKLNELGPLRADYFRIAVFHHHLLVVPSFLDDGYPELIVRNQALVLHFLIEQKVRLIMHGHTHYSIGYKYQPIFLDRSSSVSSSPIHVLATGTLSGEDLPPAQSYFHFTVLKCEHDDAGNIATGSIYAFRLEHSSLLWRNEDAVNIRFEE